MPHCDVEAGAIHPIYGLEGRPYPGIAIWQACGPGLHKRHDRYAPGLHHLALRARDATDVDALYEKLVAFGAHILDAPAAYPHYGDGYYAVFFSDHDGLKLEFVASTS